MTFVRTKKVKGQHYRQIVESRRVDGRPRQRVLLHLGALTVGDALEFWPRLVEHRRREAETYRDGARLIEAGEARFFRASHTRYGTHRYYLIPDPYQERTAEVEVLIAYMGGPPKGYTVAGEDAAQRADDHERKADDLKEKLEKLRRLRAEGKV